MIPFTNDEWKDKVTEAISRIAAHLASQRDAHHSEMLPILNVADSLNHDAIARKQTET